MALTILDPTVAAAVAAALDQTAQRAALLAAWAGGPVTVQSRQGATLRDAVTYGAWVLDSSTPRGATLGARQAGSVTTTGAPDRFVFRAGSTDIFSVTAAVSPGVADVVLPAAGAGVRADARTSLVDAVLGSFNITANPALPVSSVGATALTLSVPSTGNNGSAVTVSITPNGPIGPGGLSATLALSGGGTLGATSFSFTGGATAAQTTTLTRATTGTTTVTMTNSGGLENNPPSATYTSAVAVGFSWTIADASTVSTGRNTTTQVAVGAANTRFYASPDLLPGQTLALATDGTTLNLVGDATVPTVNGAAPGSAIDAISARQVVIEVIENPAIATIVNVTRGITYEYGANYSGRTSNQAATRWNAVLFEANVNDIIEVSPGAIQATGSDMTNYWSNVIDSAQLPVIKPLTIRNMAGRGRWKPYLGTDRQATNDNGIVIFSPSENVAGGRGNFVIEGFEFDNFGNSGNGIRIRNDPKANGVYTYMHSATTFRNFKIGRPVGFRSLSGFNGLSETMTIEDGHVYDCGAGSGGRDHNLYIAARTMYLRGLRTARTRGWRVAPTGTPWVDADKLIEGHLAKVEAVNGFVEGCSFDCAELGDQSLLLQMKGGGNWIVRGNLFVDSRYPNVANGAITMLLEGPLADPNYNWFCGIEGNSLTFERNTYVGHFPRPIIWFFDPLVGSGVAEQAMYAIGDTSVAAFRRMAPMVCRDNIASVTSTPGDYMLSGFPGSNNAMWINNDPNGGTNWAARGNTVRTYSRGAFGFNDRELLLYGDALGAPAAGEGSQSVKQFLWPHGSRDVTRSTQGLG